MKESNPGELEIKVEEGVGASEQLTLARVTGDVDLTNADELQQSIQSAGGGIVLDLTGVPFMDSSGLQVLMIEAARGDLALVLRRGSPVRRLLELAAVVDRIPCFENERDALDSLDSPDGSDA